LRRRPPPWADTGARRSFLLLVLVLVFAGHTRVVGANVGVFLALG
jgi:hypothetical protein